jgi:hypothetical protein
VKAVELYDRDFFEWTQYNAALLRERRLDEVDVEHLAEQVEDLATASGLSACGFQSRA